VMEALAQFVGSGVILANLGSSLRGLIVGFSLALILGLVLGSLMGRYRHVEKALDIYVHALFVCPSIVFAPVFFAIFGLSDMARIADHRGLCHVRHCHQYCDCDSHGRSVAGRDGALVRLR
jgi:NitT/TauT family transport system permease protein